MKALVINNIVMDIEKRDIDVFEYYHEDIAKLFVDCPEDVAIGDMYIDWEFVKPDAPDEQGVEE